MVLHNDKVEITYNYTDKKEGPDDDRWDFLLCETIFETPLYENKTARTFTQTMQVFIYFKKAKKRKKERVGHFLGVQLALTWRRWRDLNYLIHMISRKMG